MNFDKFTIKAQEAMQEAIQDAQNRGQQYVEPVHLLKGIMAKAKDVCNYLFQKMGVNASQIEKAVDSEAEHLPRVQGGETYYSSETNNVLQRHSGKEATSTHSRLTKTTKASRNTRKTSWRLQGPENSTPSSGGTTR